MWEFRFSGEPYDHSTNPQQRDDHPPSQFAQKYKPEAGKVLTVIDLGEESILLKPKVSQIDKLSKRMAKRLKKDNVSLEEILETLDEERRKYFNEKYGKKG